MQKLQMNVSNLPQDQRELLAPTAFLVKEITGLLPLNPSAHFVFEPHPSWLHPMPSSYYCWRRQQELVSIHSLHVANDFIDRYHMSVDGLQRAQLLHSDTKAKHLNIGVLNIPCPTFFFFIFVHSKLKKKIFSRNQYSPQKCQNFQ